VFTYPITKTYRLLEFEKDKAAVTKAMIKKATTK
jgi:hypothetical protein